MKRCLLSLIIIMMFLNSFSVLSMRKGEKKRECIKKFKELGEDVGYDNILLFAHLGTLKNLKLVSKEFYGKVDNIVEKIYLKDFINIRESRCQGLAGLARNLRTRLDKQTSSGKDVVMRCMFIGLDNRSRLKALNKGNFKAELSQEFSQWHEKELSLVESVAGDLKYECGAFVLTHGVMILGGVVIFGPIGGVVLGGICGLLYEWLRSSGRSYLLRLDHEKLKRVIDTEQELLEKEN